MEQAYLPGTVQDRIRDLLKEHKLTQAELAEKVGMKESLLSRFLSGKTGKLGEEYIIRIAAYFRVSTDFLLGVTALPNRKNYEITQLGLSEGAVRNLLTGKADMDVVNRLLENGSFLSLTNRIARYFDDAFAQGFAAQNEMYHTLSNLLLNERADHPEDTQRLTKAAQDVRFLQMPPHQAELTTIETQFVACLKEIKKQIGSDLDRPKALTRDAVTYMFNELVHERVLEGKPVTKRDVVRTIIGYLKPAMGNRSERFQPLIERTAETMLDAITEDDQ